MLADNELNEIMLEIVEQLRLQNRIQAIAVEALLDKKIEQQQREGEDDDTN